jgi:virginiamycin B lyase
MSAPQAGDVRIFISHSSADDESTISTAYGAPAGLTKGPDGNIWFNEGQASLVARITGLGSVTEHSTPTANSVPLYGITSGPDSNLWFTEYSAGKIGRIVP